MTNSSKVRTIRFATAFVGGAILTGLLLGGAGSVATGSTTPPASPATSVSSDRCLGHTDVSAFVCRNSWIALTRHAVR
jgi:hypothetical protein